MNELFMDIRYNIMKKHILSAVALIATSFAFANIANASDYKSIQGSLPNKKIAATLFPATDITIVNGSTNVIYVSVPGLNAIIYSGGINHITRESYYGSTFLTLRDPGNVAFHADNFCRLAIVAVFGQPGYYRITVDRELCN